jgi:hypothetical protein
LDIIPFQPAEVIETSIGSRKTKQAGRLIEFSKYQFYFLLHGIFWSVVLLYQSVWFFSEKTTAAIGTYWGPYKERRMIEPGTVQYVYKVDNKFYENETTRNGMPITQEFIEVRYLKFWPSVSRINSFESNWAGFLIAWLIFFVITSMIFFIPNDTMPRNSYIYITKRKPFLHMIVK